MKRIFHRVAGLAVLLSAGVLAGEKPPAPAERAALRAARTVAVEITQNYAWPQEKAAGDDHAAKEDEAGNVPPEKPPRDLLPLAEFTAQALGFADWQAAGPGAKGDLRLVIETNGAALGGDYIGTVAGFNYSGAELSGSVTLFLGEHEVLYESFEGRLAPPAHITRFYMQPWHAPFRELLPDYLKAVYRIEEAVFGLAPVLAGLKDGPGAHRTAAARVLFERGNAAAGPPLLDALRTGDESLGAIAAAGLGVFGDARALPALLEALRQDAAYPADLAGVADDNLADLIAFDFQSEDEDTRRATATDVAPGPRHRAVEWALLQNPAPDKVRRLTVALGDGQYPPFARRGVALVLGRLDDPLAEEGLRAALKDGIPIVRAAAVAALSQPTNYGKRRIAEALLAVTTDAHAFVQGRARAALAEFASDALTTFVSQKYGRSVLPGDHLAECLAHPDPLVRLGAVRYSAYAGAADVVTQMGKLLQTEPVPSVREAVVEVLASKTAPAQEHALIMALADVDNATRRRALDALAAHPEQSDEEAGQKPRAPLPEEALAPLLALLGTDDPPVEAWRVLERVQGRGVNAALLEISRQEHTGAALREIALIELGRRGEKQAVPLLAAHLARSGAVRYEPAFIEAAAKLDDPAMLDPLFDLLRRGPPGARLVAVRILGGMSHTRSVGPLIAVLQQAEDNGRNTELADRAREALRDLTGREFGGSAEWLHWWKENAGQPVVRPPAKKPPEEMPPGESAEGKTGEPKQD